MTAKTDDSLTVEEIESEDWDNCDRWPFFQVWYEHHMGPYCQLIQAPDLEKATRPYRGDPYFLCCVASGAEPCPVVVEEIMNFARPMFVSSDLYHTDDGAAFDLARLGHDLAVKFRLDPVNAGSRESGTPGWLIGRLEARAAMYRSYLPGLDWVCPCGLVLQGPLDPVRYIQRESGVQISVQGTVYHWCHGFSKPPATMESTRREGGNLDA